MEYDKANDEEIVDFLIKHIKDPCVGVGGQNIRHIYVSELERLLNLCPERGGIVENEARNMANRYLKIFNNQLALNKEKSKE